MALAAETADPGVLTREERQLVLILRLFALLFALGGIAFLVRPDATVSDLQRVGDLLRLRPLPPAGGPVASDFWFALAIANMATISACAWLAAADIRPRRALVYPIVVSKFASSGTGLLLFVRWAAAFPFLVIALVDLPIAIILLSALRRTRRPA